MHHQKARGPWHLPVVLVTGALGLSSGSLVQAVDLQTGEGPQPVGTGAVQSADIAAASASSNGGLQLAGGTEAVAPVEAPAAPAPAIAPVPAEATAPQPEKPPLKIGGAIRFNYVHKDFDPRYEGHGLADFDTAMINLDYDKGPFTGSAQYRYYNFRAADDNTFIQHKSGSPTNFVHHAWVGYKFNENNQIQAGINQVPFGNLPFNSHNYYFSLPYYFGFEDVYDTGVKYIHKQGPWDAQVAFYGRPAPNGHGSSEDAARYSFNIVPEGPVRNEERNQVNGRLAYKFTHGKDSSTEIGASVMAGQLHNDITGQNGTRRAEAVHLNGDYGRWNVKLEALNYKFSPRNPAGQSNDFVLMGAYDSTYEVASSGNAFTAGVAYKTPFTWGPIKNVTVYNDYGILHKTVNSFPNSQQNVTGFSFDAGKFTTYVDFILGKHHPYVGDFTSGLAAGGTDNGWHKRININVGYYF